MSFISQKVVKRLSKGCQKVVKRLSKGCHSIVKKVIHCFLIVSIEFQQNFLKDSERNFVTTQKSMVIDNQIVTTL